MKKAKGKRERLYGLFLLVETMIASMIRMIAWFSLRSCDNRFSGKIPVAPSKRSH
jgi:hypothetical protein